MSVWTRLFGRSEQQPAANKPRLGLESLEAREVPAIVFVGGWGASSYQYAFNDPRPPRGKAPARWGSRFTSSAAPTRCRS